MKGDSLGDRMKCYEDVNRNFLTRRVPAVMRLDGKAFHTFTRKHCEKCFDETFVNSMINTAALLVNEIQGAKVVYVQSDEISILLRDDDSIETSAWFDWNIQKMVSVAASMAGQTFKHMFGLNSNELVCFDARVFNIPDGEIPNYFVWRQKDWNRNSLQMYCRQFFSHRELQNKNTAAMHEMLHNAGKNWVTDLHPMWRNGTFVYRNGDVMYDKIDYHSFYWNTATDDVETENV